MPATGCRPSCPRPEPPRGPGAAAQELAAPRRRSRPWSLFPSFRLNLAPLKPGAASAVYNSQGYSHEAQASSSCHRNRFCVSKSVGFQALGAGSPVSVAVGARIYGLLVYWLSIASWYRKSLSTSAILPLRSAPDQLLSQTRYPPGNVRNFFPLVATE